MRFLAIFALLLVTGVLLFSYTLNSRDLINWDLLQERLERSEIETQSETVELVRDLYDRGVLVQYLEVESLVVMAIAIYFIVFGGISSVHITVDKFFFKKFYQSPDILTAVRRGLLWGGLALVYFYLLVNNLLQISLLAIALVVVALLEILFSSMQRNRSAKQLTEQSDEA
jgi:hypothetical protein